MPRSLHPPSCWPHATHHPSLSTPRPPTLPRPQNAPPVPDKLWLSAEKLEPEGVFLLENGAEAFVYVGKAAPPALLQALFGERPLGGAAGQGLRSGALCRRAVRALGASTGPSHHGSHPARCRHPHPHPAGVPSLDAADPSRPLLLPELDTPLSAAVRGLLDEVRRQRAAYLRLRIVRRGDAAAEQAFYNALVEDRSPAAGMSYVEYLCFLHRQIQNKL